MLRVKSVVRCAILMCCLQIRPCFRRAVNILKFLKEVIKTFTE